MGNCVYRPLDISGGGKLGRGARVSSFSSLYLFHLIAKQCLTLMGTYPLRNNMCLCTQRVALLTGICLLLDLGYFDVGQLLAPHCVIRTLVTFLGNISFIHSLDIQLTLEQCGSWGTNL